MPGSTACLTKCYAVSFTSIIKSIFARNKLACLAKRGNGKRALLIVMLLQAGVNITLSKETAQEMNLR